MKNSTILVLFLIEVILFPNPASAIPFNSPFEKPVDQTIQTVLEDVSALMDLVAEGKRVEAAQHFHTFQDGMFHLKRLYSLDKRGMLLSSLSKANQVLEKIQNLALEISYPSGQKALRDILTALYQDLRQIKYHADRYQFQTIVTTYPQVENHLRALSDFLEASNEDPLFEPGFPETLEKIQLAVPSSNRSNNLVSAPVLFEDFRARIYKIQKISGMSEARFKQGRNRAIYRALARTETNIRRIVNTLAPNKTRAGQAIQFKVQQDLGELAKPQPVAQVADAKWAIAASRMSVSDTDSEPPASCQKDHKFNAETECPFYFDFYGGVELVGNDEFSEAFPRFGFRLRSKLLENEKIFGINLKRVHLIFDFGLTSRNVDGNPTGNKIVVEGKKALEGRGGFLVDLVDWNTFYGGDDKNEHPAKNTLSFIGELGFDSLDNLTPDAGSTEALGPSDLFQHHFAGLRLTYRGKARFNGSYMDLGWGVSENFKTNESTRFKVRGYFPYQLVKGSATKFFGAMEVDSDFAKGADEVKLIFGLSLEINQVVEIFNLNRLVAVNSET